MPEPDDIDDGPDPYAGWTDRQKTQRRLELWVELFQREYDKLQEVANKSADILERLNAVYPEAQGIGGEAAKLANEVKQQARQKLARYTALADQVATPLNRAKELLAQHLAGEDVSDSEVFPAPL